MLGRLVLGSLLVSGGLLLGVVSAGLYVHSQQRAMAAAPVYERQGADVQACWVAEIAIAGHRAPARTTFTGNCQWPAVTPLGARPGFVIVTRMLQDADSPTRSEPRTFSVLLDGRQTDRWQIVDVKAATNELVVGASPVNALVH